MNEKNILYWILGIGALAGVGFYFWNKNNSANTQQYRTDIDPTNFPIADSAPVNIEINPNFNLQPQQPQQPEYTNYENLVVEDMPANPAARNENFVTANPNLIETEKTVTQEILQTTKTPSSDLRLGQIPPFNI
jgi:hypothetical protein